MMGSAVHIHVDALGRDVVIVVPVSEDAAEADQKMMPMGTPVRFTFRGSAAHVFDRESGLNLERSAPPAPEAPEEGVGDPFAQTEAAEAVQR